MLSDSEASAVESDSSRATPRRSRKVWSEAEEACLISGVEKVFNEKIDNCCNYKNLILAR